MIASLQRQIAFLEGVINTLRRELAQSRGEPAPASSARTGAATAAQAAPAATTTKRKAASTTPVRGITERQHGNRNAQDVRRLAARGLQPQPALQGRPGGTMGSTSNPPLHSPCVRTGTGSGYRSPEHRDGRLCRSGHLPVHPFACLQPYWAREDIKTARGNIVL